MNPNEAPPLAVALKDVKPRAPRGVATGRGSVAQAIIDAARAGDVPIQKSPELAAALSTVELDQQIPEALYKAVAQVLSYILRTAGHLR